MIASVSAIALPGKVQVISSASVSALSPRGKKKPLEDAQSVRTKDAKKRSRAETKKETGAIMGYEVKKMPAEFPTVCPFLSVGIACL